MATVKTEDLERFATAERGPTLLGELIRRLIYCWVPNRLATIGFHSGTANNLPGWDGHVQLRATEGEPAFNALWELSTQNATRSKIIRDVKKSFRREVPDGWDKSRTAYVAVTLRKLQDVRKLEREISSLPGNTWGRVYVIDAPALAQWIEKCPAVEAWCAEHLEIGTGVYGVSLETFWRNWSTQHRPPISTELVTAGRPVKAMDERFRPERGQTLTLLTDSAAETAGYLYAYLKQRGEREGAENALSNSLVVSSLDAAKILALQPVADTQLPVTVLLPPANEAAFILANAGHYVVNAIGYAVPSHKPVAIRRALRRDFAEALQQSMGMDAERAEQEARTCGASVSVWSVWNRHEGNALMNVPQWCEPGHLARTLPAVLASGWDERATEDKEILQTLSGVDYQTFVQEIGLHMRSDPPFLERVDSVLSVVAPTVAFALSAKRIPQPLLKTLEQCIETVFTKIDPTIVPAWDGPLTLPAEVMVQDHSSWLRDGLLETILRISAFKEVLDNEHIAYEYGGCQAFVDRVVGKIAMFRDEPRFFAALSSNLPTMAEAAPIPFVEALEQALQGSPVTLQPLFEDKGFFGPVLHTGLLSALECLAWEPTYLTRIAILLARLVEYEGDGRIVNRPSNSLRSIFLAWSPSTSATLSQRLDVLNRLAETFPTVAWRLALAILPRASDTSFPTQEPVWKDFGRSTRAPLTEEHRREAFLAYISFALSLSDSAPERQLILIDHYPMFSSEHRAMLRAQLTTTARAPNLAPSTREGILEGIRQLVARHRRFSNAVWAMPAVETDALEAVGREFRGSTVVEEVRWLFDEFLPDLADVESDINAASEKVKALRDQAFLKVLESGVDAVDDLFCKARHPYLVAQQAAESIQDTDGIFALLDRWFGRLSSRDERGVPVLCATRFALAGDDWMRQLSDATVSRGWPEWSLGLCLADMADSRTLIDSLKGKPPSAASRYWATRSQYLRSTDKPLNDEIAVALVAHGRAAELVNQSMKMLSTGIAIEVMNAALSQLAEKRESIPMLGYNVKETISWLRKQNDVSQEALDSMELRCLPLLLAELGEGEQLSFHRTMAQKPHEFIAVICAAYAPANPADEHADKDSPDPLEQANATIAWRVLRTWRTPPGLNATGEMQMPLLMEWITQARSLAEQSDRAAVADQYIGAVLLHSPPERDGRWPGDVVADALEKLGSRQIEDGLAMEVVNSRGVTTRGVLDGGALEEQLSGEWLLRAQALPERWQRAKQLCRKIAAAWRQMASEFDVEAAKRRLMS
ncbi:hypothetical protein A6V36_13995 [Paraburkholderia ginsengiterrae]|uniref:Addiction module antitoxin n=1 Tax=Paraburkholderia ginsengiterrae TaxID=1462993 RepID=A0A1A9MYC5_9BURK|nr:hypothetical protein [Paraburkholderia ginsengiterrae]OAJ52514.1 hypothetical protein A6V36_13995 [Paraburkholderia ginsengiterrae]OAJ52610.1 hypothetical protein A6V37_09205 [Paraburkholderia ginsengiterrae]